MKKLFTLLTLALVSIGSAWGDDEIFSYTIPSTATDASTEGWMDNAASGTISGTCSFYHKDGKGYYADFLEEKGYCLNGNDASVKVTLTGTNTFQTNDKVIVSFAANGTSNRSFKVRTGYKSNTNELVSSEHKNVIEEATVSLTASFNGLSTIHIERNGGGMYIYGVRIVRPSADKASPEITTDLSTAPLDVDVNIGTTLSIVAEHVTGYQWYRNSTNSTTGAEAIEGANTPSYTYTAPAEDAENTVYFYCVVTNENATSAKTATSTIAQVNVGKLPTLSSVSQKIFNPSDWDNKEYTVSTIKDNLEICNGTVDDSNQSFDGFSVTKRIKLNKDEEGTSKYVKFKVDKPCVITVYGMTGSNGNERTLAMKIGGSDVKTMSSSTYDMAKMTYVYSETSEAEVILHTTEGSGTFNVYGITVSNKNIEIGATGWATYVADANVVVSDIEDFEAYVVTGASGTAITKSEALEIIKEGEPILVKGTPNTTFYLPLAGTVKAQDGNLLKKGASGVKADDNAGFNYVLVANGTKAEFQRIVSGTVNVPENKAYLALTSDPGASGARSLDLEGNVTGISKTEDVRSKKDDVYYDLQGRRVLYPTKGLYIVNGKKVIMK